MPELCSGQEQPEQSSVLVFLSTPAPKLDLLWALLCAVEVRTDLGLAKVCLGKENSHIRAAGGCNSSTKFPLWSLRASLHQSCSEIPFYPPDTTLSTPLSPTGALRAPELYYLKKTTLEILFVLKLLLCGRAVDTCVLTLQEEPFFSSLLLWSLDLKLSEILSQLSSYCCALQVTADARARIFSKTLAGVCLSGLLQV